MDSQIPSWMPKASHIVLGIVLVALLFVGATDQGGLIRAVLSDSGEAGEGRDAAEGKEGEGKEGAGSDGQVAVVERQCPARAIVGASRVEGSVPVAPVLETLPTGGRHYLLEGPDARALSIAFTRDVFADCAKHVVVAESSDLWVLAIASRLAAFYDGPLLVNALGEAELPSGDASATAAQEGGEAGRAGGQTGQSAGGGVSADSATPALPPPQIHPDVLAELQRLDPDAATVIGSCETANEVLALMLASEESDPKAVLNPSDCSKRSVVVKFSGLTSDQEVVFIRSNGSRSDVASVAAYAASLMARETEENNDGTAMYLPRRPGPATPVRVMEAISAGRSLFPAPSLTATAAEGSTRIDAATDPAVADPAKVLADLAEGEGPQWLVAADQPAVAVLAIPAVTAAGGNLLYVDPDDLRASPLSTINVLTGPPQYGTDPRDSNTQDPGTRDSGAEALSSEASSSERASTETAVGRSPAEYPWRLVGQMPEDADWQLAVLANGQQLPGGGYVLFPSRRIVAMYGHTNTSVLGVLGEQGPAEGVERARRIAEGYDADGIPVITAFEIITTLASSAPGSDNNYSLRTAIADLKPWIDTAEQAGMYVILDLQPGRGDFLTQAKEYQELLLKPHVGLALDPEWRLKPDQFHLRQVGSVDSAEVNQVVDWLAQLVRENNLPQKLLMVHQFSHEMITNRSEIRTTPELAVMIHMDGQGRSDLKFNTYAEITRDALENGWWWGWKNFYDEDSPTLTAEETLTVRPVPYVVSYQ